MSNSKSSRDRHKLAQYEIKSLLKGESKGFGCYGKVYKVTVDGLPRIAKRLHDIFLTNEISDADKDTVRERFYNECLLLSQLDHPNVVEFVGVHFDRHSDVSLVMECLHTDLEHFLQANQSNNVPISVKLSILLDVSCGLLYLHTQLNEPLIHRDLNAGNVLLTVDNRAKIADLGTAKLLDSHLISGAVQTVCPGAIDYMPPEALQESPVYGTALDVFSFGHLSLYVTLQMYPKVFDVSDNRDEMALALKNDELQILRRKRWLYMIYHDYCHLHSIIKQCLFDKPGQRPETKILKSTMKSLCVKHPKSFEDMCFTWGDQAKETLQKKNSKLQEGLDIMTRRCSDFETRIKELNEQAKPYEIEYQTEREENDRLKAEIKQLQQRFEALPVKDEEAGTVEFLQRRIRQLNEDLATMREHSKKQSHQVLRLRQQAELTQHMEEQVGSMQVLLDEAEGEREQLRSKLIQFAAQDTDSPGPERHKKNIQLDPQDANAVELQKQNYQLVSDKVQLEQNLTSKVKDIQAIKKEMQQMESKLKDVMKSKQALRSQVETLQLQVASYKSDFEDERKDREAAHSKMADMERKIARLEGRSGHEKALLKHEVGELERDKDTILETLQARDRELQKHKQVLTDLEVVHQRRAQEASEEIEQLKGQVSQSKSDLQAKASQVRQYAKENEKLKQQLQTAVASMSVIADEMDKDRKKAFELQSKLDKVKGKEGNKERKVSLPDPSEAIEKKAAKLESLYDNAMTELQLLRKKNKELAIKLEELKRAKLDSSQLLPKKFGGSPAATPTAQVSPQLGQALVAGPCDSLVSDDIGTAGTGEFLHPSSQPLNQQQQPLRARAPDGPPQGEPSKQSPISPQASRDIHGMKLPLQLDQRRAKSGENAVHSDLNKSPSPQPAFSPKRGAKNSPTVQCSSAAACNVAVSPVSGSAVLPTTRTPASIVNSSNTKRFMSAPLNQYKVQHGDNNQRFLSGNIPATVGYAEQASGALQQPYREQLVVNDQSSLGGRLEPSANTHTFPSAQLSGQAGTPQSAPSSPYPPNIPSPMNTNLGIVGEKDSPMLAPAGYQGPPVQSPPSSLTIPDVQPEQHGKPATTSSSGMEKSNPQAQQKDHSPSTPKPLEGKVPGDAHGAEVKSEEAVENHGLLNEIVNQFENPLQRKLDDEIQQCAAKVIREVSGNQGEDLENNARPFDPNLICPMCMKKFRIGEIQFFKRHVNTCDGTDDEPVVADSTSAGGDWV